MNNSEQRFHIESPDNLLVERLPDGSIAIFSQSTQSVHSLNATSATAFEACRKPATIREIHAAIVRQAGAPAGEEIAHYAVNELQKAGLVSGPNVDRRTLVTGIGTALIPVVLTMTAAEQRVYAQASGSGTTASPTTTLDPDTGGGGPSDARLKRDLVRVGVLDNGIDLYRFRYVFGDEMYVGVLAQEAIKIAPEAVFLGRDGFYRVDYAKLGTSMMTWAAWRSQSQPAMAHN